MAAQVKYQASRSAYHFCYAGADNARIGARACNMIVFIIGSCGYYLPVLYRTGQAAVKNTFELGIAKVGVGKQNSGADIGIGYSNSRGGLKPAQRTIFIIGYSGALGK